MKSIIQIDFFLWMNDSFMKATVSAIINDTVWSFTLVEYSVGSKYWDVIDDCGQPAVLNISSLYRRSLPSLRVSEGEKQKGSSSGPKVLAFNILSVLSAVPCFLSHMQSHDQQQHLQQHSTAELSYTDLESWLNHTIAGHQQQHHHQQQQQQQQQLSCWRCESDSDSCHLHAGVKIDILPSGLAGDLENGPREIIELSVEVGAAAQGCATRNIQESEPARRCGTGQHQRKVCTMRCLKYTGSADTLAGIGATGAMAGQIWKWFVPIRARSIAVERTYQETLQ